MKRISLCVTNNIVYDQRMHRICNSLQKSGYEVTLIGRTLLDPHEHKNYPFKIYRLRCFFNKKFLFYAEFNIRLFLYLLFNRQDILCANDSDTLLACWLVAVVKNKKLVFDAHEYFIEVPELENRKLVKKIWDFITRFCIRKASLCYTVNQSLADELSQKYHKSFRVIRNVPKWEETENTSLKHQPQKFILYQGAVNKGRGLETLIEAMKELDIQLIIAGGGDLLETLKNKVRSENLENKITFTGYLPPEELKKLTKNAFLGYNLLENNSRSYYLSLSNKFFDYMHAGIPVLSSDFPEYQLITGKYQTGMLIKLEKKSIVEAIKKLLTDETFYHQLRLNSLRAAKEFCWQKEEQNLLNFYGEL